MLLSSMHGTLPACWRYYLYHLPLLKLYIRTWDSKTTSVIAGYFIIISSTNASSFLFKMRS